VVAALDEFQSQHTREQLVAGPVQLQTQTLFPRMHAHACAVARRRSSAPNQALPLLAPSASKNNIIRALELALEAKGKK
jgi:hypothetical protein